MSEYIITSDGSGGFYHNLPIGTKLTRKSLYRCGGELVGKFYAYQLGLEKVISIMDIMEIRFN